MLFCGILLFWVSSDDIGEVLYCCESFYVCFWVSQSELERQIEHEAEKSRRRKARGEHTPRASPDARPEQS